MYFYRSVEKSVVQPTELIAVGLSFQNYCHYLLTLNVPSACQCVNQS